MMQKMGTISFGRSIDSQKLLHVKREGKTMDDYETDSLAERLRR
ncbi:hypothetical protein PC114_g26566 [Phytophthora cactorum]|nr:hypothetical protein PC114_g26566 [Phytophthora cactorum]